MKQRYFCNKCANPPSSGLGLPIREWDADVQLPVRGIYDFIRQNFNSTFFDHSILDPGISTQINPERYQTTNVVKRVVNELCKELTGGNYTKAQKKEILCELQKNIKAASPSIKEPSDADIEAFAN